MSTLLLSTNKEKNEAQVEQEKYGEAYEGAVDEIPTAATFSC